MKPANVAFAIPDVRPRCIPVGRPRGSKAEGLRYEKALLGALGPPIVRGQWWQYVLAGEGKARWCQTDLLLNGASSALIIECKLSWVPEGQESLTRLYVPVVERALSKPAFGIVACRNLRRGIGAAVVGDLDEAVQAATRGFKVVLHWIPGTPVRRTEAA